MFRCRDLMFLPSLARAKLIAGRGGLDNLIRWVYKPEDMQFAKWVRGNELLIISVPVIKSKDFSLKKLLEKSVRLHMAGMLLLVGEHYITQIPPDIISYSNQMDFPIFSISGDVPLIEIFEEIGHSIAYDDQNYSEGSRLFANIIFGNAVNTDAFISKCKELNYDISLPQRMFIVRLNSSEQIQVYDCVNIITKIEKCFRKAGIPVLISHFGNNCIGCFGDIHGDCSIVKPVFLDIAESIVKEYSTCNISIGIGKPYTEIKDLYKSYREASKCIQLIEKVYDGHGIYAYEEISFYNMIMEFGNRNMTDEFIRNTLGTIIKYDSENNTNYLDTLSCYLWNNNSLLHTAEKLHMHRNSVKYRIRRIEELTGKSLEDASARLEFMNAILCIKLCG